MATARQQAAARANLVKARAARRRKFGGSLAARTSRGASARRRATRTKWPRAMAVRMGAQGGNATYRRKIAEAKQTAVRAYGKKVLGTWLPPVDSSNRRRRSKAR